jgi:hypothetical protein
MDALCVRCSSLPAHASYVSGCAWICDRGFTVEGDSCKACSCGAEEYLDASVQLGNASAKPGCPACRQCRGNCSVDEQEVRPCSVGGDRVCEACPSYTTNLDCAAGRFAKHCVCTDCGPLPANALWTSECAWQCANRYVVAASGWRCILQAGLVFTARIAVNASAFYQLQGGYFAAVTEVTAVPQERIAILEVTEITVVARRAMSRSVRVRTLLYASEADEDAVRLSLSTKSPLLQTLLAKANLPLESLEIETTITPPPKPPTNSARTRGQAQGFGAGLALLWSFWVAVLGLGSM